ncbi:ABC transporter ATP-binding protein [Pararhodospirillum photometricum]|nr:ABC transporter ATP-binding protein [Pararhodospirillum photometricum]
MLSVRVEGVSFAHGAQTVLRDIHLAARPGEFVCLLGPSGCGKSTLLRLLAGLERPDRGRILVDGRPIKGPGLDRAVVFQDYSLFPWLSAGENVLMAVRQAFPDRSRAFHHETARAHLARVHLEDAFDKMPAQLSGGMRQRAAIARALAQDAPVLLMDEPFGALDAVTRTVLQDQLLELWQGEGQEEPQRKTVFFVTHDVEEALLLATTVVVMGTRPGTIKGVFAIDLPRPRVRRSLYPTVTFQTQRQALVDLLHQGLPLDADRAA